MNTNDEYNKLLFLCTVDQKHIFVGYSMKWRMIKKYFNINVYKYD